MHKVMIVDDEAVVISQLEERLTLMGYDVVGSASSGTEAVEMARHLRPDIVLMDIVMPGRLDGIDASQKIKTELDIPAIFVTAYTDDKFIERAKNVEPFGYIVKPFQEREIKASIEIGLHKKDIERRLRESEERFRTIFEKAQDCIFIKDRSLRYTHVNPAMEQLFEVSASKLIGQTDDELFGKEAGIHIKDIDSRVLKGETTQEEQTKPMRGVPITFHVIKVPMHNSSGEITGIFGIARDITNRKNAEEELKTSRYHITMINKILRHDLINDLSVIRSALRLYGESGEEMLLKEASDRVGKSVDLIRSMRELESFISSHRNLKLYNIGSTIKEAMKSYPSIQFTIEGKGQILADQALSSVIDNIIANALIHGKADRVEIKIEKARDMCEIRIADNGIGIPDEIKKKIFEENFVHGETARTGLGLYIAKETMHNYGGSVHVEDNTPKGTVFVLKLKGVK
ncbi:MAG: response regulator [Syntrophales bacterium]|nr:response regulator [Syntrophales bacterium]